MFIETTMPTKAEAGLAVCDHLNDKLQNTQSGEARGMIGDVLMSRIEAALADPDVSLPTLPYGMKHLADEAISAATNIEPGIGLHRAFFNKVFGIDPSFSPEDQPYEISPSDWPSQDPGQPPLFEAA